ncbi:manganese-binding transcriptional regulator MntR [Aureimonas psammosilenae]|uniref:manganese-binding transcriptional regulator MntR n=1 Tax=Aureimonas psammosilenae TaxID=2495496 RepID=UPI001260697E|nr:manganese-binding transcriptional regulator MntR [Aureimonas psammosilenae]
MESDPIKLSPTQPGDGPSDAERFARVRQANQSELAEDYVEMIAELIELHGEARATDLADRFGVSPGTVARTIQRLARDGLVESQPYRSIFLTSKGRELAAAARERHLLVRDFLLAIGVGAHAAEMDAEGLEHHVGEETLAAFRRFLDRGTA